MYLYTARQWPTKMNAKMLLEKPTFPKSWQHPRSLILRILTPGYLQGPSPHLSLNQACLDRCTNGPLS